MLDWQQSALPASRNLYIRKPGQEEPCVPSFTEQLCLLTAGYLALPEEKLFLLMPSTWMQRLCIKFPYRRAAASVGEVVGGGPGAAA